MAEAKPAAAIMKQAAVEDDFGQAIFGRDTQTADSAEEDCKMNKVMLTVKSHETPSLGFERAAVPSSSYICHRCNQPGHYIRSCPTNADNTADSTRRPRPSTGIPLSCLSDISDQIGQTKPAGGFLNRPEGRLVTHKPNEAAFERVMTGWTPGDESAPRKEQVLANAFLCNLCIQPLRGATTTPCCFTNFCGECIRQKLLVTLVVLVVNSTDVAGQQLGLSTLLDRRGTRVSQV
jgi:hypothetical protein